MKLPIENSLESAAESMKTQKWPMKV